MNYSKTERQKYQQIWESVDYASGNAVKFADIVHHIIINDNQLEHFRQIVDLGCGSGATMSELLKLGHRDVYGIDITLLGIRNISKTRLLRAPLWEMSYKVMYKSSLCYADYSISTDVLEHIPPGLVAQTIQEIFTITRYKTIHAICTRPCVVKHFGYELHLTIKPLAWWKEQFDRLNKKGIEVILMDADKL